MRIFVGRVLCGAPSQMLVLVSSVEVFYRLSVFKLAHKMRSL